MKSKEPGDKKEARLSLVQCGLKTRNWLNFIVFVFCILQIILTAFIKFSIDKAANIICLFIRNVNQNYDPDPIPPTFPLHT